jgi:hypothetical protein
MLFIAYCRTGIIHYCKRPIQCLESSEILTPHPLTARRRMCLWFGGRTYSLGGEGVGGSIVWKTPDTALYSIYVSTLCIMHKVLYCCKMCQRRWRTSSGFFISWQFGSCFSWVAKKTNVTGRLSSIFFIGCGAGSLVTPPLSGFIFTSRSVSSFRLGCASFPLPRAKHYFLRQESTPGTPTKRPASKDLAMKGPATKGLEDKCAGYSRSGRKLCRVYFVRHAEHFYLGKCRAFFI